MAIGYWRAAGRVVVAGLFGAACFAAVPLDAKAQQVQAEPAVFTEALSLSRGSLKPGKTEGYIVPQQMACELVKTDWGWDRCDHIDGFAVLVAPGVDTVVIEKPNSEGHVRFEDWQSDTIEKEIEAIEADLRVGTRDQSEKLGYTIEFVGWRTYPTLDRARNYLYYATDSSWDGELVTNIRATVFDRKGYVEFLIIPDKADMTPQDVEAAINDVLGLYAPRADERYAAFTDGDKIAAIGAVGVLATMLGVNHNKAATAGIVATIIAFGKKLWFLILVPFVWVANRLRNK